jgi:hypothetical protein
MNFSGYINCDLCGKKEEERSIQDQNGHYLCFQCNGAYDDQELEEKMKTKIVNSRLDYKTRRKNERKKGVLK